MNMERTTAVKRRQTMFFRILKRDLKRKKTINTIILFFVMLSVMFVSSSVNNIVNISNGLENYFEKADLSEDYFMFTVDKHNGEDEKALKEYLESSEYLKSYETEKHLCIQAENIGYHDGKYMDFGTTGCMMPFSQAKLNYFDMDNNEIRSIEKGTMYVQSDLMKRFDLEEGDILTITVGNVQKEFKLMGKAKDAVLGASFGGGIYRFFVNDDDYESFLTEQNIEDDAIMDATLYYISTDNIPELSNAISKYKVIVTTVTLNTVKTMYIVNFLIAAVLIVASVGLLLVAMVVLRFVIGFTISEEFREIGVMKAIGLKNSTIRLMYIVKYLALACTGAAVGMVLSFPVSDFLMKMASEDIVFEGDDQFLIGILCAAAVVLLIILFAYSCTRKIRKLSPINAVRNGMNGERFGKKTFLRAGKSRLSTTSFLAVNDFVSAPKQFGIITAIITICLVLVMVMANLCNTLCSDRLLYLFNIHHSDVYINDNSLDEDIISDDNADVERALASVEKVLIDNGMSGRVSISRVFLLPITFDGRTLRKPCGVNSRLDTADLPITEGTPPQAWNEIAVTPAAAESLGAGIGDTVSIEMRGESKDYIITALFSSMMNQGDFVRLHQDTDPDNCTGYQYMQVDFDDSPDEKEIASRIEKLKEIYGDKNVLDAAGLCEDFTEVSDTMRALEYLLLIVTLVVAVLIVVLMERAFISKETGEIALMKALGFRDKVIIGQHTMRFVLASLLASVFAALLCSPVTGLIMDPIFAIMGATDSISYVLKPLEIFLICPAAVISATLAGAFFTSLYTKTITSAQAADIE